MKPLNEKLQAYLDGELSPEENLKFEQDLSPEDKEKLELESKFNSSLNQHLGQIDKECPDDLWANLKQQIHDNQEIQNTNIKEISTFSVTLPTLLKFAAIILIALGSSIFWNQKNESERSELTTITPQIRGSLTEIQQLLREKGYDLNFKAQSDSHHDVKFVGMDWIKHQTARKASARLLFICCDIPVIVYIKEAQNSPSAPLESERKYRSLKHHLKKGDERYLIDAYSNHHPAEVLDLVY